MEQLAWKIRADPESSLWKETNARHLSGADIQEPIEITA